MSNPVLLSLMIAATIGSASGAKPAPPSIALRASDEWKIVEDELGCSLRAEVPGGQRIRAVIIRPGFGTASIDTIQLEVNRSALPSEFNTGLKVGDAKPRSQYGWLTADLNSDMTGMGIDKAELKEINLGTIVLVAVPGETVSLSTSQAVLKLVQVNACDRRVIEGIVGKSIGTIDPSVTPPIAEKRLALLFSYRDYPSLAIAAHRQGLVGLIIRVGADGRVQDCIYAHRSGSDDLDKAACSIISRRARYHPSLTREGRPVEGYDRVTVRWLLPN